MPWIVLSTYGVASLTFTIAMSVTSVVIMGYWLKSPKVAVPRCFLFLSLSLAFACLVSLVAARLWPYREGGRFPDVHWSDALKAWLLFLPLPVAAVFSGLSAKQRQAIVSGWLGFSTAMAVLGIIQFFSGWPRAQPIPYMPGYFHATLLFGHHLSTASILIFPFFFALASRWYLAAGILGITLFLTWSRTLWLALPFTFILWGFRYLPQKRRWISAAGLVGGITFLAALAYRVPVIQHRVFDLMGQAERIALWKTNLQFFLDRPWFGIGWRKTADGAENHFHSIDPGQYHFVGHAHNNLIEMLAGTGLVGTLAWVFWNIYLFHFAWKHSPGTTQTSRYAWAFFCAWLALHLNGITQVNFWEGKVMHQMMFTIGLLFGQFKSRYG